MTLCESVPTVLYIQATSYNISWSEMQERLKSHPHEAAYRDKDGFTIMHHVLARKESPPASVMHALQKAYPNAAYLFNRSGESSLSLACWKRHQTYIFDCLLEAYPDATNQPDNRGIFPIEAFWMSCKHYFGCSDDRQFEHMLATRKNDDEVIQFWCKICLLLLRERSFPKNSRKEHGRVIGSDNKDANWNDHILHAAAGLPYCPVGLFKAIIERYGEHASMRSSLIEHFGRLPLGIIAASPPRVLRGIANVCTKRVASCKNQAINALIKAYPEAVAIPDHKGILPLFLAIKSGHKWEEVELLMKASPSIVSITKDKGTGLYAFMYAAVNNNSELDTLFQLTRSSPHLIALGLKGD